MTAAGQAVAADDRFWEELALRLPSALKCRCLTKEPLAKHTSWRVGGPAALYVYPDDENAVSALLQFCRENMLPHFIIGYGTNLLAHDRGWTGCVIDLANACRTLKIEGDTVKAGAGVWLNDLVKTTAESGLQGMEKLAGIPGGLGGGLSMNCGAFGGAISDCLTSVKVSEPDGTRRTLGRDEVGFQYRRAPGLVGRVVLGAGFQMPAAPRAEVVQAMEATIQERYRRNVMTLPSAGSVFKNPPGNFAAKLIEAVGAKGTRLGGAEVSTLHANFIVNARGGTAADIAGLVRHVRQQVWLKHNIRLELEVRTLGFDDAAELE